VPNPGFAAILTQVAQLLKILIAMRHVERRANGQGYPKVELARFVNVAALLVHFQQTFW